MKRTYAGIAFKTGLVILVFFIFPCGSHAQTFTVTGNWTVPISTITEAGTDYVHSIESASNKVLIDLNLGKLVGLVYNGKVLVKYVPAHWNANLNLYVKRAGSGTSCLLCSVSGGTSYLVLTQTNQTFFSLQVTLSLLGILATFSNIPIQLKLSGVSVTIPADNYSGRVVFTVTSN